MVRVRSRVYNSQKIKLNGGVIQFINGVAEIPEELYQEIVDRKFPNIYKEGEEPEYRTPLEGQLRKEVSEGNKEFEAEINRLKNIVEAQKIELSKKDEEIASWKKACEYLKSEQSSVKTETIVPQEDKVLKENPVDNALRKELEEMTVKELIEMAVTEEGGGFKESELKNKKKDDIIDAILSRS